MKFRGPLFFSFLLIAFMVAAFYPKVVDQTEKEAMLMRTILTFMDRLHFNPKPINDEFSEELYKLYLDRIDGGRRFLTQENIEKLEPYKSMLDDEALSGTYNFFDLSLQELEKGIEKTQSFYRDILAQPFDFDKEEKIELDGDDRSWASNDAELKEYWRKYLKYEAMTRLARKLEKQQEKGEEGEKKPEEELEKEAREEVLEMMDDWYGRMEKLRRNDRLSYYLNSLTNIFDPHSVYFEPIEKQNFDIRFSGKLEGIGARLQAEGDFTKVVEVVVGGPAWLGKELKENDIIIKVAQGDEDPVDIKGMNLNEVVSLIRGKKGTEVRLTIKRDGMIKTISIIRDVVEFEERYARSLILDGVEEREKIGYIYLPGFYADFEDRNGRFSADDVEKEIEKLKEESVDGIILDLRNNGGGSLRDVVKMSGYFIEEGPVVQIKSRDQKAEVLTDVDPQVQYNGPLVVMVNSFSASASEILAAALQDYNRAVIVGSKSTFGKGTVQRFYDLDRAVRGYNEIKPLGEIKLTTQKFYRINGGSTQMKGVVPDIVLPDEFAYSKIGEKEEEYALEWTKIEPVKYKQGVYKVKNLEELNARSEKRVAGNPTFQKVMERAKRMEQRRDMSEYPLNLEAFMNFSEELKEEQEQYSNIFDKVVNQGVDNLEVDLPSIHQDESKEARNKDFIESVSKDVYIKETLHILHDMIEIK